MVSIFAISGAIFLKQMKNLNKINEGEKQNKKTIKIIKSGRNKKKRSRVKKT